jgi:hypothetical protein
MIFAHRGADCAPVSAANRTLVVARPLCAPILGRTGARPHSACKRGEAVFTRSTSAADQLLYSALHGTAIRYAARSNVI